MDRTSTGPDSGGAAFPGSVRDNSKKLRRNPGMTLRDWFAGKAMVGLIANPQNSGSATVAAEIAYDIADAMIAARRCPASCVDASEHPADEHQVGLMSASEAAPDVLSACPICGEMPRIGRTCSDVITWIACASCEIERDTEAEWNLLAADREAAQAEAVPVDDRSLQFRIGEIGNQVHNIACEHQDDEDLSERLADLRSRLWAIAQELAPPAAPAPGIAEAWHTAISIVADVRNRQAPGPDFALLNDLLGQIEDARRAHLRALEGRA